MSISTRLDSYLTTNNIQYTMVHHSYSNNSISTAITASVPLNQIAKAVILQDHEDRKMMAILPANNKISFSALNDELLGSYHLINENEVYDMFIDCEQGAIPPVAAAYNMSAVCDELLDTLEMVYIEAGDHENLLRIKGEDFQAMLANSKHIRFSREAFH